MKDSTDRVIFVCLSCQLYC